MTSMLTNSRLVPGAPKRRPRSTKPKPEIILLKAKPLDILPDVSEEDEGRQSISSVSSLDSSRSAGCARRSFASTLSTCESVAERKRNSRRVVLTGAEGLTFEDFFPAANAPPRPAPAPSLFSTTTFASGSPLDEIDLRFSGLGISLDFPSPPFEKMSTASCMSRRTRNQSPTPSVSSARTTTSTLSYSSSRSRQAEAEATPPTSEDETPSPKLMCAPKRRSQHASILFTQSMPDLSRPLHMILEQLEGELDEDAEWYAQDISDLVSLPSSFPPPPLLSFPPKTRADPSARPDSIALPHQTYCGTESSPLLQVSACSQQHSSAQLDTSVPLRRISFLIPDRPAPLPPIIVSSSPTVSEVEDATEELLAELAHAALNDSFLGTGLAPQRDICLTPTSIPVSPSSTYCVPTPTLRPPPRMSLPADIINPLDEVPFTPSVGQGESQLDAGQTWPMTPQSASVYSQASMSADALPMTSSSFEFDVEIVGSRAPDTPTSRIAFDRSPDRILRSRWSSSTLGSMIDRSPSSAPFWIPKFNLSSAKKVAQKRGPAEKALASPTRHLFDHELKLLHRGARLSSDSSNGSSSSGLQRKPIPVEIFIR